jgi:hypothetical protein
VAEMMWLGALLFLAQIVCAIHPKQFSSLGTIQEQQNSQSYRKRGSEKRYHHGGGGSGYDDDGNDNDNDNDNDDNSGVMPNGFPTLAPKTKKLIEQCIIDSFIGTQLKCGNNPYAGLVRLAFHDCGTFDATNTTLRGGCNAWMHKKCDELDECEYTAEENNGLQMWVDPLDKMYNTAKVNGKHLSKFLSRADFWHLASFRAVIRSAGGNVVMNFTAGRVDPDMTTPPRFPGRLPAAFAWSEMQRVAHRNGMSDLSAAALLGAHTLGQCHPTTSGYQGAWDPTPFTFDEQYWKALLDFQWHPHTITAINGQTGQPTTKEQFSLGGSNFDVSVMLFADMGMHVDLDNPPCNVDNGDVASGVCPNNTTPTNMPKVLRAWADNPPSFFSAFARAFTNMQNWGCDNCTLVGEYTDPVDCSSYYQHTCKKGYKGSYSYWKSGYNTPAPPPSTTTPPSPYQTTTTPPTTTNGGGPTKSPGTSTAPTTTTAAPTTTTAAPTTTTAAPTTTTAAPTTTTAAPTTTTAAPTTTYAPTTTTTAPTHKPYYIQERQQKL